MSWPLAWKRAAEIRRANMGLERAKGNSVRIRLLNRGNQGNDRVDFGELEKFLDA